MLLPYVRSWLGNQRSTIPPSDLTGLLEAAEREGVEGIVLQVLGDQAAAHKEKVFSLFRSGASHLAFLEQLAGRGVEVIVLKGAALAPTVYQGKFSCRLLSDVDLLVRPQDFSEVKRIAAEILAASPAPVRIDWYGSLMNSERIPARAMLCNLSLEEIWSHSLPLTGSVRYLGPELQFIQLALHACKHSCSRLIWLVDLVLVARICDLPKMLTLARQVGALPAVELALHLIHRLFLEPTSARARWIFVQLACRRDHNLAWGEIFLALTVPGLRNKLRYLWEYSMPGSEVLGEGPRLPAALRRFRRFLSNRDRTRG